MKISLNKTVSYDVADVELLSVNISKVMDGSLLFAVPFRWLDSEAVEIRRTVNRYPQAVLEAVMGGTTDAQNLMTAFASLFTVGERPMVIIRSGVNNLSVLAIHREDVEGEKKTIIKRYTENELMDHGLSLSVLNSIIGQVASALT